MVMSHFATGNGFAYVVISFPGLLLPQYEDKVF